MSLPVKLNQIRILAIAGCLLLLAACAAPPPGERPAPVMDRAEVPTHVYREYQGAVAGDPSAQNELAIIYLYGEGIGKDYDSAFYWFQKSAEQGFTLAESNLGDMYYFGQSVEQDYRKAMEWYRKAADKGNPLAMAYVAELYAKGLGVGKNLHKAAEWYRKVLATDDLDALNNAAWFFATVKNKDLRDPEIALETMKGVVFLEDFSVFWDTLAAAYAASGDYKMAVLSQKHAIRLRQLEEGEAEAEYGERLEKYRNGEPVFYY